MSRQYSDAEKAAMRAMGINPERTSVGGDFVAGDSPDKPAGGDVDPDGKPTASTSVISIGEMDNSNVAIGDNNTIGAPQPKEELAPLALTDFEGKIHRKCPQCGAINTFFELDCPHCQTPLVKDGVNRNELITHFDAATQTLIVIGNYQQVEGYRGDMACRQIIVYGRGNTISQCVVTEKMVIRGSDHKFVSVAAIGSIEVEGENHSGLIGIISGKTGIVNNEKSPSLRFQPLTVSQPKTR